MMGKWPFAILMLVAAAVISEIRPAANAQEKSWLNQSVLPVKRSKDIPFEDTVQNKQVHYQYSGQWPLKVRADQAGWLRIHDGYHEGWVLKSDFVLVNDAPDYFERRIQTNPGDAWAWNMHGAGWSEKHEHDKAIHDYDEAIRLDPTDQVFFNNRGVAWKNKKDFERAIQDYSEAIRLQPKYALAYSNRAAAWNLQKRPDQAINDCEQALRLRPGFTWPHYHRGEAWMLKQEYDRALMDFDEAIRLDPKYTVAVYARAGCLSMKGQTTPALDSLKQALELGYRNFAHMEQDHTLDPIRDTADYHSLVKQYKKSP